MGAFHVLQPVIELLNIFGSIYLLHGTKASENEAVVKTLSLSLIILALLSTPAVKTFIKEPSNVMLSENLLSLQLSSKEWLGSPILGCHQAHLLGGGGSYKGSRHERKVQFFLTLFKRPLTPPPPFV